MNMIQKLSGTLLLILLTACATPAPIPERVVASEISKEMLLDSSPLAAATDRVIWPEDLVATSDILEVTPEMKQYLQQYVPSGMSDDGKIRQLIMSVTGRDRFQLVYDDKTRTAAETFTDRHGNCLSFTNLFIAMAREVGLNAYYQEIEIPPDWSSAGEALLISKHINVFVDMAQYTDRVVDFNTQVVHFFVHDLEPNYHRQVVSDERGRAHFFNNVGVEHLLLGADNRAAFANLRESILADPTFSPAWISLGILYRREGLPAYAEAAYLQALEVNPDSLVAMSNLASLYQLEEKKELAEAYRQQVKTHRMRNPYYRYQVAREDFVNGDYQSAVDHLKYAVRRRPDESEFHALLSQSYLMIGDRSAAQKSMQKAQETARDEKDQQRYRYKLELLTSYSQDS